MKKVMCPNCQQDWIHLIRHPDFKKPLYWCPEDDSLWFTRENLLKDSQLFGVTFTRWQSFEDLTGINDFWSKIVDLGELDDSEAQE